MAGEMMQHAETEPVRKKSKGFLKWKTVKRAATALGIRKRREHCGDAAQAPSEATISNEDARKDSGIGMPDEGGMREEDELWGASVITQAERQAEERTRAWERSNHDRVILNAILERQKRIREYNEQQEELVEDELHDCQEEHDDTAFAYESSEEDVSNVGSEQQTHPEPRAPASCSSSIYSQDDTSPQLSENPITADIADEADKQHLVQEVVATTALWTEDDQNDETLVYDVGENALQYLARLRRLAFTETQLDDGLSADVVHFLTQVPAGQSGSEGYQVSKRNYWSDLEMTMDDAATFIANKKTGKVVVDDIVDGVVLVRIVDATF